MGCGVYWDQIHELDRAMTVLERAGISTTDPAYQVLYRQRGSLMAQVGQSQNRSWDWLSFLAGESPGEIRLAHDIETGWGVEARAKPGAPPIYHRVTDEEAVAILKQEIPQELHDRLFTEDTYIGE